MALTVGKGKAEINVTPMIDVLLVLIIIFMLITPLAPVGLRALVPQPPPPGEDRPRPRDIVVMVGQTEVQINGEKVEFSALPGRLARIFQARGEGVIFIAAGKNLEFRRVAEVIDLANGVGLRKVALIAN